MSTPLARRLSPGGRVQVVAPAGPFDADAFARGVARLRTRYDARHAPDVFARHGLFAGSDERRLDELVRAIEDDAVQAIVAARGGYGATRLLAGVPPSLVATHPKLLVGFSDVTALHAIWARAGVGSLHAAMVGKLADLSDALFQRWVAAVEGPPVLALTGLERIAGGAASGPLVGGNLAVLTALLGTPFAPPLDGAVLFLEDVDERPYRLDRMLTTWRQSGAFTRVTGIALGGFTRCEPASDGVTARDVLAERLADVGVPVVAGVPAGHVDDNLELPLGARVRLDADVGTLGIDEPALRG